MDFIKKIFWSNKILLLTGFLLPFVCLILSFLFLQVSFSDGVREVIFYVFMSLNFIVFLLMAIKSVYILISGIKQKNLFFKRLGIAILYIFLGILMYYETLFSGLLLVGFS